MSDLILFINQISGFKSLNHTEKTKLFAWFVQTHLKKERFMPEDIRSCYKILSIEMPSNIPALFKSLNDRKPKIFIKDSKGYRLEKSAFDTIQSKFGQRSMQIKVEEDLKKLPKNLPSLVEREFLDEALICFRHSAFRASIVMCWNLAFNHFCDWMYKNHIAEFNLQLPKSFPKAEISSVLKIDDFALLKESQIIQVAKSANIISNDVSKILKDKLDKRNSAAHPSNVKILQYQAEDFITDLVHNVVLKLT